MERGVAAEPELDCTPVGRALERDDHTISQWAKAFAEGGAKALVLNRLVTPPASDVEQRAELKAAMKQLPWQVGIGLSNWNWKAVRQFVQDRFGLDSAGAVV